MAKKTKRAKETSGRAAAAPPPRARRGDRAFWIFAALIVPVTLLAYRPAWHGGMVWDDDGHMTKAALRSAAGLWRIWFEPGATQQYYPVVHSAFWLQFQAWGSDTTGYHLINILLHALSACLFGVILRRIGVRGAWLAAALFALHPVQVESVAWITELKNTLSGVFYFTAALVYLHFDERRTRGLYLASMGLFAPALLSKSVTATLPLGLLVVFWWQRGRIDWRRDVVPLVPFVVLGAAAGVMTTWMERTFIGAEGAGFDFTIVERTLIAGRAVCFYLASLVWPARLSFSYGRWSVSQAVWWQYVFPLVVAAALGAAWWVRDRTRSPLAALLFFGLTLGPALGFVNVYPFRYAFVADHFQYLACAGIFALAAAAIVTAAGRWLPQTQAPWLVFAIVAPLALVTWRDSHAYASVDVLYRTTIARSPDAWLPRTNLAAVLLDQKPPALEEALLHAREAVRLAPLEASTHFNLGMALEESGDRAGAVDEYRASLAHATEADRLTIRVALVHERLAGVLHDLGREQESTEEAAKATAMLADLTKLNVAGGSRTVEGQADAGVALLQSGHAAEAAQALAGLVDHVPHRLDARYAYGMALEQTGQFERAVDQFRAILAAQPAHAGAAQHLGRALHSLGRRDEAIAAYQAALALDPASAETHNDLGAAFAESGRLAEAESQFAEAVRLKPDYAGARNNLAQARKLLGK